MVDPRLPPGQQWVAAGKWPLVGEPPPDVPDGPWTIDVLGRVHHPRRWTLEELQQLPAVDITLDIHCVTRWSRPATSFRGVLLETVVSFSEPLADARFVSFVSRSPRAHSTSLPWPVARQLGVLIAWQADGRPLDREHGGPVRIITPKRYFYKSLKWLQTIELLAEDRLGYWESQAGYHNEADPWREQRYMAASLSRQQVRQLLASRDWSFQEWRSMDAAGRDLRNLNARGAVLRDADFRKANLCGACFDGSNLSNARFQGAILTNASFDGADLEGAHFEAADLRGASLRQVSLLGATFFLPTDESSCPFPAEVEQPAMVDSTTIVSRRSLDDLVPVQAAFLAARAQVVND